MVFVAQLKSALSTDDSYDRERSTHSNVVRVEGDTKIEKSYEVEKIIVKRIRKYERTSVTQYRIK